MRRNIKRIFIVAIISLLSACSVSYKFNGASINYDVIKTIQIDLFPIRSAYVWAPMKSLFNNELQDKYANQTKLIFVKRNADIHIEGEITNYDQFNKAISSSGYSSQTQLKMTVNVRFTNNKDHSKDFEKSFSANTNYDSSLQLSAVQDELVKEMINNITDQIFNATVADW